MRFLFALLFAAGMLAAQTTVRYDLSFPNAVHHEAEVRITFSGVGPAPLEVVMSRSSPGRYALHEFAKNISHFRAADGAGHGLETRHPTPYSWTITPANATVVCTYTLFGDRTDGTYAAIDLTHAHLNLPAALAWAHGYEKAPATLAFHVPEGSGWKARTQLIPVDETTFSAPNLEWMMDSPVELSAGVLREWKLDGATFRLALHHNGSDAEAASFADMCKTVVAEEESVFGAFPKYDNGTYTFLVDYLPYVNGDGMEHRDSTVVTGRLDLRTSAHTAVGTISHEFFHSWNVKRIRPRSLEPFDFERTDMSGELWFAEGFTNYYGNLVLRRANLASFDEFLTSMSQAVNAVLNNPGRNVFSPAGMSEQAPFVDAAASIDPTNKANDFISYYTYGQALAFGIDLAIRAGYPGKSLDDWMRTMWREHPDIDRPYTMDDLERALTVTTGDAAFARDLFTHHIQGLQPLDYARLVAPAGLTVALAKPGQAWLGTTKLTPSSTGGVEVTGSTLRASPSYQAGIDSGDEILECGGTTLKDVAGLDSCLASHRPGEQVMFKVKARSGVRSVAVTLMQDPTVALVPVEKMSKTVSRSVEQFRSDWLSSKIVHESR